jgi:DNA repair protein RadC
LYRQPPEIQVYRAISALPFVADRQVTRGSFQEEVDIVAMSDIDRSIVHRVLSAGVRGASAVELLAISLSRRSEDVAPAEIPSQKLLQRFRSLRGLGEVSSSELREATGLDDFEVLRVQSLLELGRRMAAAGAGPKDLIECSADVAAMFDHLRFEKREHFLTVLLDAKGGVIRTAEIHVGTLTMSVVGPREVFREAVREGAASLIVIHNHPSGDPTPSPEDEQVTRQLVKIGEVLDIPVQDHVIIGDRKHFSFADHRMM